MKRFVRQFAIMMVVVLLFQMLPIGAGQLRPVLAAPSAKSPVLLGRDQWTEDESLRTAYAKHYRAGDFMVAEVSTTPIHYKDSNGKWKEIAAGLSPAEDGDVSSDLGHYKVRMTAKEKANTVRVELANGRTLTMETDETLPGVAKGNVRFDAAAEGRSMRYKDREGRFEVEYQANPDGIKELITLKKHTTKTEWSFPLTLDGMELMETGTGGYYLVDAESGEHLGMVPPPVVWDAEKQMAPGLAWTVTRNENGVALGLQIDPAWLEAKERKYPVTIDPSVVIAPKGADLVAMSIVLSQGSSTGWQAGSGYIDFRHTNDIEARPLIKFDLSAIPQGALIQSATMSVLRPISYSCGSAPPLTVHEVTQPWNLAATWTSPSGNGTSWVTAGGSHDLQGLGNLTTGSVTVTNLVQGWVNQTKQNNGLLVRTSSTGDAYCAGQLQNPTLQVVYAEDVLPPTVTFTGLAANAKVSSATAVQVTADDTTNGIRSVELIVDGTVVVQQKNPSSTPDLSAVPDLEVTLTLDPRQVGPGPHTVSVAAYDFAGNRSTSQVVLVEVAIPQEPYSLDAKPSGMGADLTWEAPIDGKAVKYNVYRSATATLAPVAADRIAAGVTALSYADKTLTGAKAEAYYYAVTAVDAAGVESRPVVTMAAFPFAPGQPIFDTGTRVLSWAASPRAGVTYSVYREDRAASVPAQPIAAGLTDTKHTVTQTHSASVFYRVYAFDGQVRSSSSPDSVLTATPGYDLAARNLGGGNAELTWTPFPSTVGLTLQRRAPTPIGTIGNWADVATVTGAARYVDLAAGTGSKEYRLVGNPYVSAPVGVTITDEAFPATDLVAQDSAGRQWFDPTFARSSVAYDAAGTEIAPGKPRFVSGNSTTGILVEHGATNLVKDAAFDSPTPINASASPWKYVSSLQAGEVVTKDATQSRSAAALKVVAKGTNGAGVKQALTGWAAGQTVTLSGYLFVERYVQGKVNLDFIGSDAASVKTVDTIGIVVGSVTNGFVRYSQTVTIPAETSTLYVRAFADGTPDVTFYVDQVQVEARDYATSATSVSDNVTNSVRAPETLAIPGSTLSGAEGTVEFWFTPTTNPTTWGRLFERGLYTWPRTTDQLSVYWGPGWGLNKVIAELGAGPSGATAYAQVTLPTALAPGRRYYVAVRWQLPGSLKLTVYDQTTGQVHTDSPAASMQPPTFSNYPYAFLGSDDPNDLANVIYDELMISKTARSDADITAHYTGGPDFPVDDNTTYRLGLSGNLVHDEPLSTGRSGQINLTWEPSMTPGATYSVYRTEQPQGLPGPAPSAAKHTFARPGAAFDAYGMQVATDIPRYSPGKFGQGIFIEEGTTNSLANPSFESYTGTNGAADYWSPYSASGTATFALIGSAWQGSRAQKVANSGMANNNDATWIDQPGSVTGGSPFAYSAYVNIRSLTNASLQLYIDFYNSSGAFITSASQAFTSPTGIYTRYTLTGTVPAGAAQARYYVILRATAAGGSGELWVDAVQMETKSFATSWINGSRSAEKLTVPISGLSAIRGTAEMWAYVQKLPAPGGISTLLADWHGSSAGNPTSLFWHVTADGKVQFASSAMGGGLSTTVASSSANTVKPGWNHLALTWNAGAVSLYHQGALVGSGNLPSGSTSLYPLSPTITVGSFDFAWTGYQHYLNGVIDELRISNTARSAADIAASYASSTPFGVDASTVIKLGFDAGTRIASGLTTTAFIDSANLLANSGFEALQTSASPEVWTPAALGGLTDTSTKKYGAASAKFTRTSSDAAKAQSLTQTVQLQQSQASPVTISGWSKASGVAAPTASNYALTVRLEDASGVSVGNTTLTFAPGTHDWERRSYTVTPTAPAARAIVTVQFTGSATGTAWFDGIQLQPGVSATDWVEGPVLPDHVYLYQIETVAPNGKTSLSQVASAFSRSWSTASGGDAPGLGLDGRWGFADLPLPGGTAYLNLTTGNLVMTATDSVVPGPRLAQVFRRTYNSRGTADPGPLGTQAWSLNAVQTLEEDTATGAVTLVEGDGTRLVFKRNADGISYTAPPSVWMTLTKTTGTYTWRIARRDGIVYQFDTAQVSGKTQHRLRRMSEPNGNELLYTYDASGLLTTVTAPTVGSAILTYEGGRLKQIRDAAGRAVIYGYDASGRLTTVTDPMDLTLTYTYDTAGRITAITDAGGRAVRLTYDSQGRLTAHAWDEVGGTTSISYQSGAGLNQATVTDPLGRVSRFVTNTTGNLLSVRDALGNSTAYQYDALQRMVNVTNPRGLSISIAYEGQTPRVTTVTQWVDEPIVTAYANYTAFDQPGLITDPMGTKTYLRYDAAGNLLEQTVGHGTALASTTTHTYKPNGMPLTTTDAMGNTTTYEVDDAGRVTAITNPLGGRTQMAYDAAGNLISTLDPNRSETRMQYDALGRQTSIKYADGGVATYSYDRSGNLVEQVAPGNIRTTYQYDQAGRLISTTDNAGAVTRFTYDEVGNLILTALPNGSMTRQEYDELGRVIKTYDGVNLNTDGTPIPGAYFTENRYDATGNLIAVKLPNGYTATAEYDLLNRMTKVSQPPNTTAYTYDKVGRTLAVRDGNGNWTRYEYDLLGQLVKVYDAMNLDAAGQPKAGGLYTSYTYDKAGHRTAVTIPRSASAQDTTTTQYNALGLPTLVTDPLGQVSYTEYDIGGRVVRTLDRNGNEIFYEYDPVGRPLRIRYQDDCSGSTFVYDAAGRRKSASCSCGVTYYSYDTVGRLTEELTPDGAMQYEYDAAGLRTAMKLVNQGDLEWSVTYQYDRANRLQSVTDSAGSVTTLRYAQTGELAEIFHPFGVKESITTDRVTNRVTNRSYDSASAGTIKSYAYKYDAVGNIVEADGKRYEYDANYRLTAVKTFDYSSNTWGPIETYSYDAAGNRLTRMGGSYEYGPGGLLLRSNDYSGTTLYSYDGEGHLIQQQNPDGTSVYYTYNSRGLLTKTQEGTKFTYNQYDVDGRRIARRVTNAGYGGTEVASESVRFQYDGIQVVATRDAANGLKMAYARMPGGQLVSWYAPGLERTPTNRPETYENRGIFILDHLGSVVSLRDSIGEVNGYTYDAFGNPTSQTGNAPNELKFTGAPMDGNGLVHLGARFYKPSVGRFITQDTYKGSPWVPWTQNLYVYVGNNPVRYTDPTGHACKAADDSSSDCPNSGSGSGSKTVTSDFVDMQGNHWYKYSDGSEGVKCWNGATSTPCPDRYPDKNSVPSGYQCVVTGGTCSTMPPLDPDFVHVTISYQKGSLTFTMDRDGKVYVTASGGVSIAPLTLSGGMGWVVADTGDSLESTLSGAGYGGCGTILGVMVCQSQSSNGSIMVSVGFETTAFDVSQTGGYTILIPKKGE